MAGLATRRSRSDRPRRTSVVDRLLSPSKITAWLDCGHYLTLRDRLDAGLLTTEIAGFGSFARLLADKGSQHEAECLAHYRAEGRSIYEVPPRDLGERFDQWVARVGTPWDDGYDVIYQMPFVHDGMRGIADFLVKVDDPSEGASAYEPLDAKLARTEAKPGHVLQLCFYADALRATTGAAPERLHLWLGSGHIESLVTREFHPYWNRLRSQLRDLLDDDAPVQDTQPLPCTHCEFCEFAAVCDAQWRDEDSLVYVAGIRATDVLDLEESDISTLAGLAGLAELPEQAVEVPAIRPERLQRLVTQAGLQVEARVDLARTPAVPPHRGRRRSDVGPRPGAAARAGRRRHLLGLRGGPLLDGRARPLLPLRAHRTRRRRHLDVRGPLGSRPRRGGAGDGRSHRVPGEAPGRPPGHARLPLQPHGAISPRAPRGRARRR